jgi:hypothetical protein
MQNYDKQRTPQQASIDAREAREYWERGEEIEFDYGSQGWRTWDKKSPSHPWFTSTEYNWRVATKTTPTITPGKWRMRNGATVPVKKIKDPTAPFIWISECGTYSWDNRGMLFASETTSPYDLLTRVETRWRAWRPEEVPLGAVTRSRLNKDDKRLITSTCFHNPDELTIWLADRELLQPDGTYVPCGVEEEVK